MRVPVDSSIMRTDSSGNVVLDEKGFAHIDPEKMAKRGVELSNAPNVKWFAESRAIEPHPIQRAPEPQERAAL